LKEQENLPPEESINSPDCLYALQQAVFLPLAGDHIIKIVQLPYQYADNSVYIITWKDVLDELKEDQTIISYKFLPEQLPTSILVEYPSSSSCSASIG
tara:strand:+ start:2342 stop:2635 length:294 start_codon:yes stop_codon:yes gene_type:complete